MHKWNKSQQAKYPTKSFTSTMRNKQTMKHAQANIVQSPLKPLILGLCSLGLLSGCSQLPKTFGETSNSSNSAELKTSTDIRHSAIGQSELTVDNNLLGLDSKQEIHQRAITDPSELTDQPKKLTFYANVWDEIANNLQMGNQHYDDFSEYVSYYKKRPNYLKRVSKRAQPYMHFIFSEVKNRNMPYEIALLPIIESGFQIKAQSHQSAVGLWQFIPQTAHLYGLEQNWWYDGRKNIVQSTEAALAYLKKLHDLNNGDWLLALASYNGGIGNVWKAVKKHKKKHPKIKQPSFWQIKPYLPKETQHYVPQLLAVAHTIKNRNEFKQNLEPIDNKPYFKVSKLEKQISLDKVASLSGTPSELLAKLNSGYLRPATPPNGPYNIVIPTENFELFQNQLAEDRSVFDIQWTKHKVRSGDTLSEIAQKYNTSSKAVRKLNNMRNSTIRVGKTLLIPLPQQYAKAFNSDNKPKSSYKGPKFNHTVKAGESLWTIAHYYNTDTKTLCNWNNIGVRTPLRKGQKLEIRSGKYGHQQTYTLKNGDSLWTVAKKFGVTTTELSKWNRIKRSEVLQPGMKLTVWQPESKNSKTARLLDSKQFKHYTVKSGDSLWNIAKANKLSTKVIARYNQIPEKAFLKPGQVLKIPYDQNT